MNRYDAHGKKIWLIGASAGIGAALARELALKGAALLVSGRNEAALRQLTASLPGTQHEVWPLDVTARESFHATALRLAAAHPDLAMAIYNAGTYEPKYVPEMTLASSLKTIDTNLAGAYIMLDAIIPNMLERGGNIVLVASVASYFGLPRAASYSASKAGIYTLAETLKVELAPHHIDVQVVCPGFVRTRLTENNPFPMPLAISPEEAAREIMKGIERRHFEIHFPKGFTVPMKIMAMLPRPLRFALLRRAVVKIASARKS